MIFVPSWFTYHFCRGRLLVSVRTQVLPDMAVMQLPPSVHVEAVPPVADDSSQAVSADFFLSAVVMEAHMIDKRFQVRTRYGLIV